MYMYIDKRVYRRKRIPPLCDQVCSTSKKRPRQDPSDIEIVRIPPHQLLARSKHHVAAATLLLLHGDLIIAAGPYLHIVHRHDLGTLLKQTPPFPIELVYYCTSDTGKRLHIAMYVTIHIYIHTHIYIYIYMSL